MDLVEAISPLPALRKVHQLSTKSTGGSVEPLELIHQPAQTAQWRDRSAKAAG